MRLGKLPAKSHMSPKIICSGLVASTVARLRPDEATRFSKSYAAELTRRGVPEDAALRFLQSLSNPTARLDRSVTAHQSAPTAMTPLPRSVHHHAFTAGLVGLAGATWFSHEGLVGNHDASYSGSHFVGIGSDHTTPVYEAVTRILESLFNAGRFSVVTAEQKIFNRYLRGEEKTLAALTSTGSSLNYNVVTRHGEDNHVAIRVEDRFSVYGARGQRQTPEISAAIDFAARHHLPLYFVEFNQDYPYMVFEFNNGKMTTFDLRNFIFEQPEAVQFIDARGKFKTIAIDDIATRNLYTALAQRFLSQVFSTRSMAHVGGIGRFDALTGPWSFGDRSIAISPEDELTNHLDPDTLPLIFDARRAQAEIAGQNSSEALPSWQ